MKKMLEELKKLDKDYEVPLDFSKNVMKKVKKLNNEKKHFSRYVIAYASTAAVVAIAAVVALNNNLSKKSFNELHSISQNENSMANAVEVEDNTILAGASLNGIDGDDVSLKNTADLLEMNNDGSEDAANQKFSLTQRENSNQKNNVSLDEIKTNSIFSYSTSASYSGDDVMQEVEDILNKNNIKIGEIGEDFILVDSNIQKINEILGDYIEEVQVIEFNGKIKIQKEV